MNNPYKIFFILGGVLLMIGAVLFVLQKFNIPIGRLPGDIVIKKENFSFYFPVVSCLVVSVLLTLFFNFFKK